VLGSWQAGGVRYHFSKRQSARLVAFVTILKRHPLGYVATVAPKRVEATVLSEFLRNEHLELCKHVTAGEGKGTLGRPTTMQE